MAIPFYENEEQLQQQPGGVTQEIDQVDGPVLHTESIAPNPALSNPTQNLVAWKILAVAMCKALKDHYQQNMVTPSSTTSANSSISTTESSAAVIQILPNGQVKPQWN